MSGSASLGLEQAILGHTLGFAPLAFPARVYVGLCSAALAPAEATAGIEIAGGGYTRQPATFALASSPANVAANTATIEWPVATASWGPIGYFELWDAQTDGTRLYWGAIVDPASAPVPLTIDVDTGDIVRFSAGTLSVGAGTSAGGAGVASFNTRTGDVVLDSDDITGAGGALLDGPQNHTGAHTFNVTPGTTPLLVNGGYIPSGPFTTSLALQVTSAALGNAGMELYAAGNTATSGGTVFMTGRSYVTTAAGVPAGRNMLTLRAFGWNGTAYQSVNAQIDFQAAEAFTLTGNGTRIIFSTTPLGATARAEAMRLTASGSLLIGTTTEETNAKIDVAGASRFRVAPGAQWVTITANTLPATPPPPANVMLQLTGIDGTSARMNMDAFGATPASFVSFRRAGGTSAAQTTVPTNTAIGGLQWWGHDGVDYTITPRASLGVITPATGGAWSATSHPTILQFQVTNVGSTTMAEAMRIAPSGNLLLGTTTDGVFKLDVVGATRLLGDVVTGGKSGFNGTTPITKPTVTGAKGSNAALASLIAALVAYGLVTDSTGA